ncbi:MAG: hypothetical protein HYV92_10535 [Candidatus Rokubacteria bacterium]|nr:hypothetical protein [Candidatus Rokubacteria bacterium]
MRVFRLLGVMLFLSGCSVISIDFTPRIQPVREQTVEGSGAAKVLLMDLSGVISEEPLLTLGSQAPRVSLLARVREELKKAEEDDRVRALVVRVNSPGGTATASDILYHEISSTTRSPPSRRGRRSPWSRRLWTWGPRAATMSRWRPTRSLPTRPPSPGPSAS